MKEVQEEEANVPSKGQLSPQVVVLQMALPFMIYEDVYF